MKHQGGGRSTGKTFRTLLYALQLCSEGKQVVFVSRAGTDSLNKYYYDNALRICNAYLSPDSVRGDNQSRTLYIKDGWIRFGTNNAQGIKGITWVEDD